MKSFLKNLMW